MTTAQINRDFEAVWTGTDGWRLNGHRYLCIPEVTMQREGDRPLEPEPPAVDTDPKYAKTRRVRVLAALPGTILELVARSGIRKATVYTALAKLRKDGQLTSTRINHGPTVYALKTSTCPVQYSRIGA